MSCIDNADSLGRQPVPTCRHHPAVGKVHTAKVGYSFEFRRRCGTTPREFRRQESLL